MLTRMLQETVVFHDLPYDPLAAWYYKQDEGSGVIDEAEAMKAGDNAGKTWMLQHLQCSLTLHLCKCKLAALHSLGSANLLHAGCS